MPDHYVESEVRSNDQIKDIIRSSFYTGNAKSMVSVFSRSMARLSFTLSETSHAYVDVFVELCQRRWGNSKGYVIGHWLAGIVPAAVLVLFIVLILKVCT